MIGHDIGIQESEDAGLVLWLRADMGITFGTGLNVSKWADSSGTGDVNKHCLQPTLANQPTFTLNNPLFNFQPTVVFNGTTAYLVSGTWTTALSQPFTSFFVGSTIAQAGNTIGLDNLAAHQTSLASNTNTPNIFAGSSEINSSSGSFANPTIVAATFNGASSQIWVNQQTGQTPGNAGSNNMTGTTIGGFGASPGNTTNSWSGPIAEIAIYNVLLSAAQIAQIIVDLGTRYNITIGA